jgi:tetratricopeptide (TPR) repeat protein
MLIPEHGVRLLSADVPQRYVSAGTLQVFAIGTPSSPDSATSTGIVACYSLQQAIQASRQSHIIVSLGTSLPDLDSFADVTEQLSGQDFLLVRCSGGNVPIGSLPVVSYLVFPRNLLSGFAAEEAYQSFSSLVSALSSLARRTSLPVVREVAKEAEGFEADLPQQPIAEFSAAPTHTYLADEGRLVEHVIAERDDANTPTRPLLSLCMIVRDNEAIIRECLESVRPWVDEIVIVDTGSQDQTARIARDCGANIFHFPWCDSFSAARNESLRLANGEWLFWMDSDDTISPHNGQKLRHLVEGPHPSDRLGYIMQVACLGSEDELNTDITIVDHVKLFRNRPGLRFEGRIHEQILPAIRRERGSVEWTDIVIEHTHGARSNEQRQHKHQRDLQLLDLENTERPDHPFTLFNLGMTYADMGRYEDAVSVLSRSILVGNPQDSQVRKTYALLACSLISLNRLHPAQEVLTKALELFPDDQELLFRRGICHQVAGNYREAAVSYHAALKASSERAFRSIDRGIGGYKCRHNLALTLQALGDMDQAREQWRQAISEEPRFAPAWRGLIDLELAENRTHVAYDLLREMREIDGLSIAVSLAAIEVFRFDHQDDRADDLLEQQFERFPENRAIAEQYAQRMFALERWSAAERALLAQSRLAPSDPAVYHNLAIVYLNQKQYFASRIYAQQALSIAPQRHETRDLLNTIDEFFDEHAAIKR